jgi:indole-3-glycerol phosphate synthase
MTGKAAAGADLLATIVAAARRIVEIRSDREPPTALARRAEQAPTRPGVFRAALARTGQVNIVAECKRRSPSRGVLREHYDPVAIARSYADAGASALSVLTEPTFFDGSLDHLTAVRRAVELPVLRKDFIVSEYQLLEARAAGADAALLIVAALAQQDLTTLVARCAALGLDALVEVHTREELARARDAGARIVGVNNRNLRTLAVDVHASDDLIAAMPPGIVAVSESGLKTSGDLSRLRRAGYHAFLIGERLMTADDPGSALRELVGGVEREVLS